MRAGADHTILKQSTKVSALGIMGSYRQINCALNESDPRSDMDYLGSSENKA